MSYREVSEVRDGMQIDWDVPITMDDGLVLRADVFRPIEKGKYPVLLSYGPYGKWLHFEDGYKTAWSRMVDQHPDVVAGSTNKYQSWEVCDPEKWVPDGYVCVRVDSRGCGRSPGYVEHWSPREAQGLRRVHRVGGHAEMVERQGRPERHLLLRDEPVAGRGAAAEASGGAVHLGRRRRLLPRPLPSRRHLLHLCAELVRHAGAYRAVRAGSRGYRSRMNGDWVSGPDVLTSEEMGGNRFDLGTTYFAHALYDDYWKAMMPDFSKIKVPLLSTANWGGQRAAPARQFRGLRALGFARQMAGGARHRALDPLLHRLRRADSEEVLRPFPQRGEERLEQGAEGPPAGAPHRQVRRALRGRVADPAHQVDQVSPRRRTTVWRPRPRRAASSRSTRSATA